MSAAQKIETGAEVSQTERGPPPPPQFLVPLAPEPSCTRHTTGHLSVPSTLTHHSHAAPCTEVEDSSDPTLVYQLGSGDLLRTLERRLALFLFEPFPEVEFSPEEAALSQALRPCLRDTQGKGGIGALFSDEAENFDDMPPLLPVVWPHMGAGGGVGDDGKIPAVTERDGVANDKVPALANGDSTANDKVPALADSEGVADDEVSPLTDGYIDDGVPLPDSDIDDGVPPPTDSDVDSDTDDGVPLTGSDVDGEAHD